MATEPTKLLVAATTVISILFGGSWVVSQTQFAYVDKDKEIIRQQLVSSQAQIEQRFKDINADNERHREQSVEQVEFKQFEARMDHQFAELQARLTLLEQTRPTTGELRGIADNADKQIARILDRLDQEKK
jgi:hypothetical protein